MKPSREDMSVAGKPTFRDALEALRAYRDAKAGDAPWDEVEGLRLLAESLFQVVSDYQLRVVAKARGKNLPPLH